MELQHLESPLEEKMALPSARINQPSLGQKERRRNLFGREMKKQRRRRSLSEVGLAKIVGMSRDEITCLEEGEKSSLSVPIEKMEMIADSLGFKLNVDPLPLHARNNTTFASLIAYAAKRGKNLTFAFVPKA